jgi:DNA-binding FrmR family transcriptional regulator
LAHFKPNKSKLIARVNRISGQMAAIEKALQDDLPCASVLQQVAGVRGAVNGLLDEIIEDHLREHVARAGLSADERSAGAEELISVIRRYSK